MTPRGERLPHQLPHHLLRRRCRVCRRCRGRAATSGSPRVRVPTPRRARSCRTQQGSPGFPMVAASPPMAAARRTWLHLRPLTSPPRRCRAIRPQESRSWRNSAIRQPVVSRSWRKPQRPAQRPDSRGRCRTCGKTARTVALPSRNERNCELPQRSTLLPVAGEIGSFGSDVHCLDLLRRYYSRDDLAHQTDDAA